MTKLRDMTSGPINRGVVGESAEKIIKIWGRGKKKDSKHICYLWVKMVGNRLSDKHVKYCKVTAETDYTSMMEFPDLIDDQMYSYDAGYINILPDVDMEELSEKIYAMEMDLPYKCCLPSEKRRWSFIFGSCRYQFELGPVRLFGTGESSDKIYETIYHHDPEFFLSIGDQIYLDPIGSVLRNKNIDDIRKLYRNARKYDGIRMLYSSTPIYEMCDDHDIHRNDTDYFKQIADINAYQNAVQAYMEYQHHCGPHSPLKLYYSFDRQNATFFVMDTRTGRTEDRIISNDQMADVKKWLRDEKNMDKVKFLVSPVPFASQTEPDSFYGFPEQQREIVETMFGYDDAGEAIKNVFILAGDAHCGRVAQYRVTNEHNEIVGELIEVISSGLAAIKHDRGKPYTNPNDCKLTVEYDSDNNFPFCVDNLGRKGLLFTTVYATNTHPNPHKANGIIDKLSVPFKMVTDNIFVQVSIDVNGVTFEIYNQKNTPLETIHVKLF